MFKKYLSECLLITAQDNLNSLIDWLNWHLNIIGFDHITLIDNSKTKIPKKAAELFNNIEYISIDGTISQSEIYTKFIDKSNAYWVLPIDDDEILYIPDEYNNNINNFIINKVNKLSEPFYKIGFSWLMMFSKNLLSNSNNSFLEDFNYYCILDVFYKEDFFCQKTMVNTIAKHYYYNNCISKKISYHDINADFMYEYSKNYHIINSDFLGSVHNPISKINDKYIHSYNVSNDIKTIGYKTYKSPNLNNPLLLHYKYQTIDSWNKKINRNRFNDIVAGYYDNFYRMNTIYIIYDYVKDKLHKFDNVKNLYLKNKN